MISLKLKDNTSVSVKAFYFKGTYEGILEGRYGRELNKRVFASACSPWENRKEYTIQVTESDLNTKLPPLLYSVLLDSEPIGEGDQSRLIVNWFGGYPNNKSIESIIEEAVKSINWKGYAKDYCYFD